VDSKTSEIYREVERILESRWLRESAQLSSLLRFVVRQTLEGHPDDLKEYNLGLQVFHRPPDYDPRSDAIVRVQASLLRKRLASYYENEGRHSTLRIEIPRGGYVPAFHPVPSGASPASPAPTLAPPPGINWRHFAAAATTGAAVATLVFSLFLLSDRRLRRPSAPAPALWAAFLQPGSDSIVSFGVPLFYAGAGIFLRDTRVNATGDESKGRVADIEHVLGEPVRPQEDVYTGIGDLVGAHEIIRWLEARGVKAALANSHYLGHSDVAGKNLVVVSSIRFQTLLQEMSLPSRFTFDGSSSGAFIVDQPLPGEPKVFRATSGTGVDTSYAVLTLWPGKHPARRILCLSGITTWATQGSAHYVIDDAKTADLQSRLDADPPTGPRGPKGPFFQVLLRIEGKNNQARTADYVTHRYLPPI
jgi:hypothetical protein